MARSLQESVQSSVPAREHCMYSNVPLPDVYEAFTLHFNLRVEKTLIFLLSLQLSQDLGYVMYSAFGSFYIPSCIMVFVYIKIYFAARDRARRNIMKRKSRRKSNRLAVQAAAAKKQANNAAAAKPAVSTPVSSVSAVSEAGKPAGNTGPNKQVTKNIAGALKFKEMAT